MHAHASELVRIGRTGHDLRVRHLRTERGHVFDLLLVDGEELRGLPTLERKARLAQFLGNAPALRNAHLTAGDAIL